LATELEEEDYRAEEEDSVLRCVRELRYEVADLRKDRALTAANQPAVIGVDLQSQLSKLDEEQTAAKDRLEAQTSAIDQLQQQMNRIEQLCLKLNDDLNTLTAK